MSFRSRAAAFAVTVACVVVVGDALADKVATLHAKGPAPLAERTQMRVTSEIAVKALGHETIAETDVLQGEGAAGSKAGTSEGYVAIGKAAGADWVIEPSVWSSDSGTRVEVKVCQVATGRIETLARNLDPKADPAVQIREMLTLMLRPQGIGDDPIPWQAKEKTAPPVPAEVLPKKPPPPPPPPPSPPVQYGEGGKVALGAGGGAYFVVARPEHARGSTLTPTWSIAAAFQLPDRPRMEIVARFGGYHGPGNALRGELGARAFFLGTGPIVLGATAVIGAFGQLGGAQTAQFLLGASLTTSFVFSRRIQLDVDVPSFRLATGADSGSLALLGADASLLFRF